MVCSQASNQGRGAAVRRGISEARGQFIMVQDADYEYDPNEIAGLLHPLLDGRAAPYIGTETRLIWPRK